MSLMWHISSDPAREAIAALTDILRERQGMPTLLLVSGGSWLSLYDQLEGSDVTDWSQLSLMMADERVTRDPAYSNAAAFAATQLCADATERGATFFNTMPHEDELPDEHAARMEHTVRDWRVAHPDGMVIATLGLGADGHTAGILPKDQRPKTPFSAFDADAWFVSYGSLRPDGERIRSTITATGLRALVTETIVYATGDAKRDALCALRAGEGDPDLMPSLLLHDLEYVDIYTDEPCYTENL